MLYTSLIGKKVISVYDGKISSYIIDILFSKKGNVSSFVAIDEDNESEQIIEIKDIFKIGEDAVLIKNSTKIIVSGHNCKNIFINKEVFDINGSSLGNVLDIEIDNLKISKILTTKSHFLFDEIISLNSVIMINNSSNMKKHHFAPKKKQIQINSSQKVSITGSKIPVRVTSYNSLLGRKLFKDLVGKNNIILASKNSFVTATTMNLAKQHNVLNELSKSVLWLCWPFRHFLLHLN